MIHGTIFIDHERCKGCNLCVQFCPQEVIALDGSRLNAKGYHPATLITDEDHECTGCAICAVVCPDVCITVYRETAKPRHTVQTQGV
jgi:2-oxoglutarate ferredoxin oxidoreductase subunit delta